MTRIRRALPLLLALAATLGFSTGAAAQNVCNLIYQTGEWVSVGAEGQRVINASGPLLVRCNNGEELRADSAVIYEAINEVHLFRRVDYQDPTRSLTSDYATYNGGTGRLWATGSVVFTDKNRGSTLRGPNLEYYRAGATRPDAQAIATERPHLTVAPRRGSRGKPMEIDADRITTVGEKFMTAEGRVVIEGEEMDAWAQEAYYDADQERMELRREARAKGESYELTGDFIQSDLTEGSVDEVLSRGNARLVESRLRVTGPQLRLFFARDSLQRLVSGQLPGTVSDSNAVKGRSVALARGFRMEADSLEALTPGQRIRQVVAIGTAEGQSWDTTRVAGPDPSDPAAPDTVPTQALGEQDLIFADTITGFFKEDTVAPGAAAATPAADSARTGLVRPDTARAARPDSTEAELERMLATGNARSLYRMTPSREEAADTTLKRGINYVIADTIDLSFAEGEVNIATVRGLKRGVYLDPIKADSAGGDSLRVDTGQVAAGTRAGPAAGPPSVRPAASGTPPSDDAPSTPPATTTAAPAPRGRAAPRHAGGALMSGFDALVGATGPGDLSKLIALRALVDRVNGDGTVERASWLTGVREEYHRWYARDGVQPENFAAGETVHYLDEHIVGSLSRDGVLEPIARSGAEEPHPDGEVTWTAVRLSAWAAQDVDARRGEVLELLDGRIRGILEHTRTGDAAPAAPVDLPPAPVETTAHGMEVVNPGGMLVAGGATLSARGLIKTYRKRRVVNEVDLQVSQGEIVGLLGPNGAGKTTSFYMMVGLIRPDKGKVFIGERNLTGIPMYRRARAGIGYLAQEPSIFRKLTVEENVMAILQMMKIKRADRKARLEQLLDELSIKHLRKTRAYALSGGERRRLEITRALVGNPKFMLLDEPFAGVDPIAVHDIQQIVSDLRRRGIGVLISDHNVEQTLDIVDRAYIMYDGRVRVSGTVSELVWNEEVAEIYLGPTLTARMRERYANPADLQSAAHDPRFGVDFGEDLDGDGSVDRFSASESFATDGGGSASGFGSTAGSGADGGGSASGFGSSESFGAGAGGSASGFGSTGSFGADAGGSADGFGSAASFGADAGGSVDRFGAAGSFGTGGSGAVDGDGSGPPRSSGADGDSGSVDGERGRGSGPVDAFDLDRTIDAGVAAGGSGLGGWGPAGGFDDGRTVSGAVEADARAADFGEFAGAGEARDGRTADGDERDGAGDQPDASQDHTRNPREGEAA